MKDKMLNHKIRFIVFCCIFLVLIFFYVVLFLINRDLIKEYDNRILPSIYLDDIDVSNYTYDEMVDVVKEHGNKIMAKKVVLVSKNKEVTTTIGDMGLYVDLDKTLSKIKKFQKRLTYPQKLWYINGHNSMNKFHFVFGLDEEKYKLFFNSLSEQAGIKPIDGYFDTSVGVKYIPGSSGFQLNYDKNKNYIEKYFTGNYDDSLLKIDLIGEEVAATSDEKYIGIDTMTSSFVTEYDTWVTQRAQNLRTGVNYINGAIVQPGEVFSFYSYAGPYNKAGYVFYYEFVGNGVCQVATTVYDAALLGGHEIVTRTPHKKKSVYVAGGLDATVASADNGSWNTDMQFRNTYDYPIYIKAYDTYGEIHVEFWSHKDAKKGKTYTTESVWLGGRGYRTFLHTFKDGAEIAKDEITTTWYSED